MCCGLRLASLISHCRNISNNFAQLTHSLALIRATCTPPKALSTLTKYFSNILKSPTQQRFRNIKTTNKIFRDKVARCKNALSLMNKRYDCTFFVNPEADFVASVPIYMHDGRLEEVIKELKTLEGNI